MLAQDQPDLSQPGHDFAMGELAPRQQVLPRLSRVTRAAFTLVNYSNAAVAFQLTGQSETPGCRVELGLPSGWTAWGELSLQPDEAATIPVRITMSQPPLFALKRRRYRFTVTATMLGRRPVARSLLGRAETVPLIGPWLAGLVGLSLVAGAVWLIPAGLFSRGNLRGADTGLLSPATPVQLAPGLLVTPAYLAGTPPPELAKPAGEGVGSGTYQQLFEEVGRQYDLDWHILAEIAYQESHFNPWAIGRQNEMGLMQINPLTWNEWAPQVGADNPYDPYHNVRVAAAYLVYLRRYCQVQGYGEDHWMLIAYNWGPDNLQQLFNQRGGLEQVPEQPRQYALRIMRQGAEVELRRRSELEAMIAPGSKAPGQ